MSMKKLIRFKDDEYTARGIDSVCSLLDAVKKDRLTLEWVMFYTVDHALLHSMEASIGQRNFKLFNMIIEEIRDVD